MSMSFEPPLGRRYKTLYSVPLLTSSDPVSTTHQPYKAKKVFFISNQEEQPKFICIVLYTEKCINYSGLYTGKCINYKALYTGKHMNYRALYTVKNILIE